jgi:protein-tyrosine phosphatase
MNYTDMHNHIVPGVDDGSENMEESMELVEMAYQEGIRRLICTPHYMRGRNHYTYEQLDETFAAFADMVRQQHPDIELWLGNEVLYEEGIVEDLKAGKIHTMAGTKYVLIEFNIRIPYAELYQAMKKVSAARFRPIIAHVERYQCLTKHEERIQELRELGIYIQMNASSVEGGLFDEHARWCQKLLKKGYIDFIGTDAHDLENRAPVIGDAVKWITKKCGEEVAEDVFWNNAAQVIQNQYI